jgi:hypothetical protein
VEKDVTAAVIPSFLGPLKRVSLVAPLSRVRNFLRMTSEPAGRALQRQLPLEKQDQTEWCWASVGSAVHAYRNGETISQCKVACKVRERPDCCTAPSSSACNSPSSLRKTLALLGNLRGQPIAGPIDAAALDQEIAADRPLCCGLKNGDVGHFIVVIGWYRSGVQTMVKIKDPAFTNSLKEVPLRQLRQGYRGFTWHETYLTA